MIVHLIQRTPQIVFLLIAIFSMIVRLILGTSSLLYILSAKFALTGALTSSSQKYSSYNF